MYGYFEIQSTIGITKHLGGLTATKILLERCQVDESKYVLVVGSGSGRSAFKMVQMTQCKIVGIDLSAEMVNCAKEKGDIEFMVGDAEDIPFPDNTFDAVLSESVTAFTDKVKSLQEYFRVLKPGGYLGLNEITWLEQPSAETMEYAQNVMGGMNPSDQAGWFASIEQAGFSNIIVEAGPLKKFEQFMGELQMNGALLPKIFANFISVYLSDSVFRKSIHQFSIAAVKLPRGFLKSFGGGLYTGQKV